MKREIFPNSVLLKVTKEHPFADANGVIIGGVGFQEPFYESRALAFQRAEREARERIHRYA